ncbi:MAG TPA: NAD(+)/NADH kinase, partial [Phaeodactylibacter sp.]|nr:NAD(+)/NADH kinase [Phaeodactylibacter sp.]
MKILPVLGKQKGVREFYDELLMNGLEEDYYNPEIILVLGGDGTMLSAQRQYYKRNIPFLGIGFGDINFLLHRQIKQPAQLAMVLRKRNWKRLLTGGLRAYIDTDIGRQNGIAFNDVYIKSANPAGMVRLQVNTNEYQNKMVRGDGLIIASPQGSTAYNRTAGGTILPIGSGLWAVTGICTSEKFNTAVSQQQIDIDILRGPAIAVTDNKVFANVQ